MRRRWPELRQFSWSKTAKLTREVYAQAAERFRKRPKALFLSPECPYPARGGGPLRSASLLEYLACRFSVHAIVFRQPGDPDPARAIPPGRIEKLDILDLPYHSKRPSLARCAIPGGWSATFLR